MAGIDSIEEMKAVLSSDNVRNSCHRLDTFFRDVLDRSFLRQNIFYESYSDILTTLFGSNESVYKSKPNSWFVRAPIAVLQCLSPSKRNGSRGSAFNIIFTHGLDSFAPRFEVPLTNLPKGMECALRSLAQTQVMSSHNPYQALNGVSSSFYKDKFHPNQPNVISLNLYEYFFFCFASHALFGDLNRSKKNNRLKRKKYCDKLETYFNKLSGAFMWKYEDHTLPKRAESKQIYQLILQDFLDFFLPSEEGKHSPQQFNGQKTSRKLPAILTVLSEFWLNQNVPNGNTYDYVIPSIQLCKSVQRLLIHILAQSSRHSDSKVTSPCHPLPIQYIRQPLFHFIKSTLSYSQRTEKWKKVFFEVLLSWRYYIEPWMATTHKKKMKVLWKDTPKKEKKSSLMAILSFVETLIHPLTTFLKQMQPTTLYDSHNNGPTMSSIPTPTFSQGWEPFILDNFVFYTVLLVDLLQIVQRLDFDQQSERPNFRCLKLLVDALKTYHPALVNLIHTKERQLLERQRITQQSMGLNDQKKYCFEPNLFGASTTMTLCASPPWLPNHRKIEDTRERLAKDLVTKLSPKRSSTQKKEEENMCKKILFLLFFQETPIFKFQNNFARQLKGLPAMSISSPIKGADQWRFQKYNKDLAQDGKIICSKLDVPDAMVGSEIWKLPVMSTEIASLIPVLRLISDSIDSKAHFYFDSSFSIAPVARSFASWKILGYLILSFYLLSYHPIFFVTFILLFPVLSMILWYDTEKVRVPTETAFLISPLQMVSDWINQQFSISPVVQICLHLSMLFLFLFCNSTSINYTIFFITLSFLFRYFTSRA